MKMCAWSDEAWEEEITICKDPWLHKAWNKTPDENEERPRTFKKDSRWLSNIYDTIEWALNSQIVAQLIGTHNCPLNMQVAWWCRTKKANRCGDVGADKVVDIARHVGKSETKIVEDISSFKWLQKRYEETG